MIKCDICEEAMVLKIAALPCGHLYHRECIDNNQNKLCPTCNRPYDSPMKLHPKFIPVTNERDVEREFLEIRRGIREINQNVQYVEARVQQWRGRMLSWTRATSPLQNIGLEITYENTPSHEQQEQEVPLSNEDDDEYAKLLQRAREEFGGELQYPPMTPIHLTFSPGYDYCMTSEHSSDHSPCYDSQLSSERGFDGCSEETETETEVSDENETDLSDEQGSLAMSLEE